MTDLNGGALFNAEFGIRHRDSTVPERSGVALSFRRRRVFYYLMAAFCSMANASEGSIDVMRENYVHSLLHAAGMQGEVMKNFKEDPQGAPVYLYKLGLSRILMAWEKSGEDPARKVQIEQEGCSMIRRAAEEGLIVAGVAQLSLCYSALEEELTAEKRDAAKALLLKRAAAKTECNT
ncbi:hypothetical protein CO724_01775 [Ectopseudomonas mendocina]|nr:hypothetical protein CO724_01775 [Pseudomonas mendocina]